MEELLAQPSPLSEADPESLDELFRRIDLKLAKGMPREITDVEIDRVVDYLRKQRVRFVEEQAQNIKPTRAAGAKKPRNVKEALAAIEITF